MRVLFISPRQCWPPVTGAKLREYYLARSVGRHAPLTDVFFVKPGDPALESAALPFCEQVFPVPAPPMYTPGKMIRGLLTSRPLPVLNYSSPEMAAQLETVLRAGAFDLIQLESLHMCAYLSLIESLSQAPIVLDWHNIESEAMLRHSTGAGSLARRLYARITAARLAEFERHALRRIAGHIVCSAREKEQVSAIAPAARIAVIENGVDTARFPELSDAPVERRRLVYVGSMDYLPNVEAVVWFAHSAWPAIHAALPELRLTLVGSNPAREVLALASHDGIEVTGTVPDVQPYYREALAAVVPLRTGGGTRLKILEAMAAGVPVVSSKLGAEGLAVSPGGDILLAESPEDWARSLTELAPQGGLWKQLAESGRRLVRSRYDWEIIGAELLGFYRQLCKGVGA